jgi:transposase
MAEKRGLQPHRVRSWMKLQIENEADFAKQVKEVVELHQAARVLAAEGVRIVSCDEKTGMQALEWLGQWPMKPGQPKRQEAWYKRHGTQCLTANLDLATGRVVAPTIASTRTNADFIGHIERTVATDPSAKWVFVVDNLDTHKSPELVEWIAAQCAVKDELGKKFAHGHLRDRRSRSAFLSDPAHRIRFVYTPKHCSWLNEIERWFSKLARSVLRRGSFAGLDKLRTAVLEYISYYNTVEARPHQWRIDAPALLAKFRIAI